MGEGRGHPVRVGLLVAALALTAGAQDTLFLNGSPVPASAPIGGVVVLHLYGPAGVPFVLGLSPSPGPTGVSGMAVALGLGPGLVTIGDGAPFPASGRMVLSAPVPSSHALFGVTWHAPRRGATT